MGEGNVEFHHISVMLEETVKGLVTNKEGIYVDCTLGGAGHSHRIAVKCHVDIVHSNFSHLEEILEAQGAPLVDGVVFDLGVSSHQIDTAERGFSYMHDAPLDMRMDPEAKFSAYDVVNTYSEKELDRIFHDYGEERWGRRIALQGGAEGGAPGGQRPSGEAHLPGHPHRGQRRARHPREGVPHGGASPEAGRAHRDHHLPLAGGPHREADAQGDGARLHLPAGTAGLRLPP